MNSNHLFNRKSIIYFQVNITDSDRKKLYKKRKGPNNVSIIAVGNPIVMNICMTSFITSHTYKMRMEGMKFYVHIKNFKEFP